MSFDGRLAGTLERPALEGTVSAPALRVTEGLHVGVDADVAMDRNRLTVTRADLAAGENHATLRGTLGFARRSIDAEADASIGNFAALWQAADLPSRWLPHGRIDARAEVTGRLDDPRVDTRVTGTLGVGALDAAPVFARLQLDGRQLTASDIRIETPAGPVTGDTTVDFGPQSRPFRVSAAAALDAAERLAPAFAPAAWPLAGAWHLRVSSEGTLADPGAASVDAVVERIDGTVAGVPILLDRTARLQRVQDRVTVAGLVLRSSRSVATLDGTIGRETALTARIDAQLEDLTPLFANRPAASRPVLRGSVHLDARATGALAHPVLDATLTGEHLGASIGDLPAADVSIDAILRDGVFTVRRLAGRWQEATFGAEITVPLGQGRSRGFSASCATFCLQRQDRRESRSRSSASPPQRSRPSSRRNSWRASAAASRPVRRSRRIASRWTRCAAKSSWTRPR